MEHAEVSVEVPMSFLRDANLLETSQVSLVPRQRSGDPATSAAIAIELVGLAANMVTIAVAHEDLRNICARLIDWARGSSSNSETATEITIKYRKSGTVVNLSTDNPSSQLVNDVISAIRTESE
ncbi:hypothetical protein [Kineococcus sp. SYSU DK005]|uniref:hypothetical protein n=1 Tax=Kineococcus sp. SYSU DK005 TaxID=3383126 RepID=UPI003D7C858F